MAWEVKKFIEEKLSEVKKIVGDKNAVVATSGGGKPLVGFLQPRGGTLPGGRMGFREGYVKIPEAHEYQPPKEFRQELLEALKEKYPEIYKELIKQYYRRLTE
ncbi:unnamed protein product [marine sediment metagenome]|uniref:Uncharacterized protein n=1 Tax=marine sediment metagenome TaxID=412755 RepID=X1MCR1_9ZZZZ